MEEMGGQASAFRSTEEEVGGDWRQSRRNAEDASEACCPGWVGMEVGKGQQAQARKHLGSRTRNRAVIMRRTRPPPRIIGGGTCSR